MTTDLLQNLSWRAIALIGFSVLVVAIIVAVIMNPGTSPSSSESADTPTPEGVASESRYEGVHL